MKCTDGATLPKLESLPDDVATLKGMIVQLLQALHTSRHESESLQHRLAELLRRLYGKRSEKIDPNQLLLFPELLEAAQPPVEAAAEPQADAASNDDHADGDKTDDDSKKKKKPGHGRKRLPEHLPRERVIHDLADAEKICPCCGKLLSKIGEETSEQLEYTPAIFKVLVHVRYKYACESTCETGVVRAALPAQPIDKGLPGSGLLAYIAVGKYADHLPLYRLEGIVARSGVEISRKTMCGWMAHCAELLSPVYRRMIAKIKESKKIHTDDTVVPVLDPELDRTKTGRLWAYLGDDDHPYTIFDYTPDRTRAGPVEWLKDFRGYPQADAYGAYDGIYLEENSAIVEVACWAHARRKFFDAQKSDQWRSTHAMAMIGQLYAVEREAKASAAAFEKETGKPMPRPDYHALRCRLRQEQAKPVMEKIVAWLDAESREVLPKSPMGLAIAYAQNNLVALQRYLEVGMLEIDNNAAERAIKNVVIGRKNWLFAGSDNGGKTAAIFFSLTVTCKQLGINPWAYLKDLLDRVSTHPAKDINDLLPDRWAQTGFQAAVNESLAPG